MYDDKSWHFVAVENNKVICCAVLVPPEEKSNKARLIQMAADTAAQGQGVRKLLIHQIIAFAKTRKIKEVTCHSRTYVVNFYKSLVFKVLVSLLKKLVFRIII
ncbi:GNAT family N-acetyltransferase [Sinomicrobium sp. M5D2P17]